MSPGFLLRLEVALVFELFVSFPLGTLLRLLGAAEFVKRLGVVSAVRLAVCGAGA